MNRSDATLGRALLVIGLAVFVGYLVLFYGFLERGREDARRGGEPLYTDFVQLYAASRMLQEDEAAQLFSVAGLHAAYVETAREMYGPDLREAQARRVTFSPWQYPPHFMFFIYPLAWAGYLAALIGWLAVTGALYVIAVCRTLDARLGLALALAAPPVFFNAFQGQTGFLIAGLIGLGLACLPSRPLVAGLLIGLAVCKPHLGVLLPVALVAGRHWTAFASATGTVLVVGLASLLVFGSETWSNYLGTFAYSFSSFESGFVRLDWMVSPYGSALFAGLDPGMARAIQGVFSILCVLAVAFAWRPGSGVGHAPRCALVCTAALLSVPAAYLYDLALMVPAVGWLWEDMRRRGATAWEGPVLIALLALSLFQLGLGRDLHLPTGFLSVAGLFLLALYRSWRSRGQPGTGRGAGWPSREPVEVTANRRRREPPGQGLRQAVANLFPGPPRVGTAVRTGRHLRRWIGDPTPGALLEAGGPMGRSPRAGPAAVAAG